VLRGSTLFSADFAVKKNLHPGFTFATAFSLGLMMFAASAFKNIVTGPHIRIVFSLDWC
jgi:hypothetical protein